MSELVGLLERLAGQKAFEEGVVLFLDKTVDSLKIEGPEIVAVVHGDDDYYRVKLKRTPNNIEGACSCPASEDFDFCEHCVAVALAINKQESELKALQLGDVNQRITALVKQMSEQEAKDALIKVIDDDKDLLAKWELIADAKSGQLKASTIKKRITKAFPLKSISQTSKVQEYFDNALLKLQIVFDVIPQMDAKQAFSCAEYLLSRYDAILSRVDDSSGARHKLFKSIEPLFHDCFKGLPWTDSEKVDYLMTLYNSDYSHFEFVELPQRFIANDDVKMLSAFHQRLESHIKNSGVRTRKATGKLEPMSRDMLWSLAYFCEHQQDIESAIKWYQQASDSVEGYSRFIEFLIDNKMVKEGNDAINSAREIAGTAYERRVVELLEKRLMAEV